MAPCPGGVRLGAREHTDPWAALQGVVFYRETAICSAEIFKSLPSLPGSRLTQRILTEIGGRTTSFPKETGGHVL